MPGKVVTLFACAVLWVLLAYGRAPFGGPAGADDPAADAPTDEALRAAVAGDTRALRAAVRRGVDLDAEGGCLLYLAAANGQLESVRVLLTSGVDPNAPTLPGVPCTALAPAAAQGHAAIIDLLLEAGADPFLPTPVGRTPLQLAEEAGHREAAALLRRWAEGRGA